MRSIQESITSILRERSVQRHLALVVSMIAVATALAVFWGLHLNGITMTSDDPVCGMEEHTHTADCYAWVPVEEDTEGNTEPEETATDTETEQGTESTETASGTETMTVSGTAIDTETTTESVQTENGTETVTEEETEMALVGDTKNVNGVEYVYSLVCGMEEHTHTDACYADDSTEEDFTAEEISETETEENSNVTAGVSQMFYEKRVYLGGAAATADEPTVASVLTSSGTGDTYYFADSTTLADAANNQDNSYIVYTMIENSSAASGYDYYVVSADDTLVPCEYLGDATNGYDVDSNLVNDTAPEGMYCWKDKSGNLCFKCTTVSTDDVFDDYRWTLSGTVTDSASGSGSYTIYNSENSVYIAPQDLTVSETLTSSVWWSGTGIGKDYELASNQMLIFTVKCTADVNNYAAFSVELYDDTTYPTNAHYLTTGSDGNAWFADANQTAGYANTAVGNISGVLDPFSSDVVSGTTYIVTVERTDSGSYSTYTITYYNQTTGQTHVEITATNTDLVANPVNIHIIAQVGTYEVSTVYAVSKEITGTGNTSGTTDCDDLTVTSVATVDDTDSYTGYTKLKGDFEIKYTFYNAGSNSNTSNHYVLGLYNGSDKYVYLWANSSYTESGSSSTASVTTSNEGGWAYPSSGSTWRGYMAAGKSTSDSSYTICYVTVKRVKNVITITTIQSRKGSSSSDVETPFYYYTTTIIDSAFSGDVTLFLTGRNCTLTGVSTEVSDITYDVTAYDAYSAVGSWGTSLSLTGSTSDGSITLASATSKLSEVVEFSTDSSPVTTFRESVPSTSVTTLYLARVRGYTAWFDGTNGGMATNSTSSDTAVFTTANAAGTTFSVTAPTATNTLSLGYTLRGWYDIYNATYHKVGDTITLTDNTVLYADWEIADYDIGQDADTVSTVSTGNFMDIELFDFNELFNIYSVNLVKSVTASETAGDGNEYSNTFTTSLSSGSHSEAFKNITSGTALSQLDTLNFLFFRNEYYQYYYTTKDTVGIRAPRIDYPADRSEQNISSTAATQKILGNLLTEEDDVALLSMLFDKDNTVDKAANISSAVYGKTHVGSADYLFQYDSATGYYYYDSALNAAAYNQTAGRFYVYDYLTAIKSGNSTSDFMPFNYITKAKSYTSSSNKVETNYVNYWFGMSTKISFYLSDTVASGNNKGIDG